MDRLVCTLAKKYVRTSSITPALIAFAISLGMFVSLPEVAAARPQAQANSVASAQLPAAVTEVCAPTLLPTLAPRLAGPALKVVVTVAPLKSFIEPMLPMGSEVTILMQPGRSEHGYEFTPSDLRKIAKADIVLYVGLDLEPQVAKFLSQRPNASRRDICFADAVGINVTDEHDHADHAGEPKTNLAQGEQGHVHGPGCNHGPVDPHLWLDPILCAQLVPVVRLNIEKELVERNAYTVDDRAILQKSELALLDRIAEVNANWIVGVNAFAGQSIVTHHNAFSRLADRYGFEVAEVIQEIATVEPSPAQVASIVKAINEKKVRAIFVEPQFNGVLAQRIAKSAGVRLGRIDPLGTGDWFVLMASNLRSLTENLAEPNLAEPNLAEPNRNESSKQPSASSTTAPAGASRQ